jgi:hypothetical protein
MDIGPARATIIGFTSSWENGVACEMGVDLILFGATAGLGGIPREWRARSLAVS